MAALGLAFSDVLAALLAGALAGLGVLTFVSGLLLALQEREEGAYLYVEHGLIRPRRFVASR
jgi:hypothetical protein